MAITPFVISMASLSWSVCSSSTPKTPSIWSNAKIQPVFFRTNTTIKHVVNKTSILLNQDENEISYFQFFRSGWQLRRFWNLLRNKKSKTSAKVVKKRFYFMAAVYPFLDKNPIQIPINVTPKTVDRIAVLPDSKT